MPGLPFVAELLLVLLLLLLLLDRFLGCGNSRKA